MENKDIAAMLVQIADTLEIHGDNPYRVRAYRRAARSVLSVKHNIASLIQLETDITFIPNIGKGIASQISIIVKTGKLPEIIKPSTESKPFRNELKDVAGIGPKRLQYLRQLEITTKAELIKAINAGDLRLSKLFNQRVEKEIIDSMTNPKLYERFFRLSSAMLIIENLLGKIKQLPTVEFAQCASAYRRQAEMIGNITVLVIAKKPEAVIEAFTAFSEVKELVSITTELVTVILTSGMQVTLRFTKQSSFGAAMILSTGSEKHLIDLNALLVKKNFMLKNSGLYKNQKRIAGKTESEIYDTLGLQFIPAELREGKGEIDASQDRILPNLVVLKDIKGDLHSHTNETDGTETLDTMVQAAIMRGYEYLAITDHSQRLAITNGLNAKRLLEQIKLIDKLNEKLKNFVILKSIEVDILEDGSLDLSNDILKELDIRVCSIHSRFNLPEEKQTARILRAMENPYFNILGHATGRLLRSRPPYPINIVQVLEAAKANGCFVELNAQPSRLDIKDEYCLMAKTLGVKVAISSDAHSILEFDYLKYGVAQARRGWLEPSDVINTRSVADLLKLIKR